jgi:energy-coupling factor transport system substrate-specific component
MTAGHRNEARHAVVRIGGRSAVAVGLASIAGLAMFLWPLLLHPHPGTAHSSDAPFVFLLLLPAIVAVVLSELGQGAMDAKTLAMLGVLTAVGAGLRPLGAGTGGIELVFFLLILAGRVYGPGFGFVLGATTLFASALLTGGVGPWLPFQMLASSWTGLGAGLLPRATGRAEIALLAAYGAVTAFGFGLLLNLSFWPFAFGSSGTGGGSLAFVPGASVAHNLHTFLLFTAATSVWGWDTARAITNVIAICVAGPAVLATLRRAARRAAFDAPVEFDASAVPTGGG